MVQKEIAAKLKIQMRLPYLAGTLSSRKAQFVPWVYYILTTDPGTARQGRCKRDKRDKSMAFSKSCQTISPTPSNQIIHRTPPRRPFGEVAKGAKKFMKTWRSWRLRGLTTGFMAQTLTLRKPYRFPNYYLNVSGIF